MVIEAVEVANCVMCGELAVLLSFLAVGSLIKGDAIDLAATLIGALFMIYCSTSSALKAFSKTEGSPND